MDYKKLHPWDVGPAEAIKIQQQLRSQVRAEKFTGKVNLVGRYQDRSEEAGSTAPLIDRVEQVGVALRTKRKVNPVYISIGNRIDLESAIEIVMQTVKGYRIPDPTRQAHLLMNELRR